MVQCSHVVGDVNSVKDTLFLELVITRGYEMRETTIEGQNAFAPTLCFVVLCGSFTSRMVKTRVIRLRVFEGQNARDPFHSFFSGSPNESWLHTCNACVITREGGTWVFFGRVCAARDSKLAPRSKKNSPKIDTPF